MKKYILSALVALGSATMFTACDDMLDTDPRATEATQSTFPGKVGDVEALNAATYSIMNSMGGGDADTQNPYYWWEIMSDNCYGSGGLQDNKVKSLHHLVEMNVDQYQEPFKLLYGGIARANAQISTIDNISWDGKEAKRNQLLGEGYFMRGYYTLLLTQLFGDVPLITSSIITEEMEEEVSAEEVIYPQIFSDFVSGINLMGDKEFAGSGHANKYVAESFLARAYMFWAGFYKKVGELATGSVPEVALVEQEGCKGGTLAKNDVVNYLKDVYGKYELLKDYRSLWQYSNSLVWRETQNALATGAGHHYDFIADMALEDCFDMPGNGNGNKEEIFQIQFMNASNWNITNPNQGDPTGYATARMYCNYLSVFWALRVNGNNGNRDYTYPFTQGWGQGTPSCNIWDDWSTAEANGGFTDLRKKASLIDGETSAKEIDYDYVKDCCEASGFGVKKYNGVTVDALTGDSPWWDACEGWTSSSLDNPMQGDHFEDFYLMRYADVLLMLTELTGEAQYMNQVQKRAGVPETPYSLKAVQDERRWEFAFEGLRFNDMRRWTGKGTKGGYASKALQAQEGKLMVCLGDKSNKREMKHMTCSWTERYEATDGFLAKPQSQITIMNGKLTQNAGWDASDPKTQYKTLY